jgi:hypothetical protein
MKRLVTKASTDQSRKKIMCEGRLDTKRKMASFSSVKPPLSAAQL